MGRMYFEPSVGTGREKHSAGKSIHKACRRKLIRTKDEVDVQKRMTGGGAGVMDWRGQRVRGRRGRGR